MPTVGKQTASAQTSAAQATRELLVVDVSVAVSLLIDPGPVGASIGARMANATLFAPVLLPFEVTNVLRRKRNAGLLSHAEASLARDGFAELPIELWPWEVLSDRAWQLGDNLTSYDAAYVALAEHAGAVLLTRDRRIAGAPGVACTIEVF